MLVLYKSGRTRWQHFGLHEKEKYIAPAIVLLLSACGPGEANLRGAANSGVDDAVVAHGLLQHGNASQARVKWEHALKSTKEWPINWHSLEMSKRTAIYSTDIAWTYLLDGNTIEARSWYQRALEELENADEEERDRRQENANKAEFITSALTLGLAVAASKQKDPVTGRSYLSPEQLGSLVYVPKMDPVAIRRNWPEYFETDGVRAILFPDGGWLRSVAKIITPSGHCTGFQWGQTLVITNAHCVTNAGSLVKGNYVVSFQRLVGAEARGVTSIWTHQAEGKWDGTNENDWAVLHLDKRVAVAYPFKGWVDIGSTGSPPQERVATAGFSGDLNDGSWMGLHWGCRIVSVGSYGKTMEHNCRTWAGASGSPIFLTEGGFAGYVVGIHNSGVRTRDFDQRRAFGVVFHKDLRDTLERAANQADATLGPGTAEWTVY